MKNILFVLSLTLTLTIHSQSLYFPPLTGTTWDTIKPSTLGYCQPRIDSLYNYLATKNSKSFIVLKDGKIVLEKYFGTYTKDSLWYWASAGKSLSSFITGLAQQKGYININNLVSQYIGTSWTSETLVKENMITVKHLLQMASGLDDAPPLPCDQLDSAKSCLIYKADAGTRWGYHTGAYYKTHDVVTSAVGQTYNTITNSWIKTKTGMGGIWQQNIYYSKARDMARFGLLALNKGIWQNDTIMKDSLYFKAMTNTSQPINLSYGYLWWLNGKASAMAPGSQILVPGTLISNAPSDMFCALGKNDQKIYVVPSQKLVVIRQGNTAGGFNFASSAFDNVLWNYINKLTCSTASIDDIGQSKTIEIYPNPVSSELYIEAKNIVTVSIINMLGEKIECPKYLTDNGIQINCSTLLNGLYQIELTTTNGIVQRTKVVKVGQ